MSPQPCAWKTQGQCCGPELYRVPQHCETLCPQGYTTVAEAEGRGGVK